MNKLETTNAIPKEVALQLCSEIRQEVLGKWYTMAGMQCRGCMTFSKGDLAKLCISNRPDYRGCALVNARYDQQFAQAEQSRTS